MNGSIASTTQTLLNNHTYNVIKTSKVLDICTYNVRTLRNNEHLDCFLNEVKDIKWDVIGLCETKLSNAFVEAVKSNHYITVVSKKMRDAQMELVFVSKNNFNDYVTEFKPISDRIAMMKIRGKYNKLVIIQAYPPPSEYTDEDIENFHCELRNVINCVSNRDILLVNGDMNCKDG